MRKITLFILTICFSLSSYAQLPETFDTEIPATWAIFPGTNGLGPNQTWGWNSNGFPLIIWEDVVGGLAEDWLVTPQLSVTSMTNLLTVDISDLNAGDFASNITIRVSTGASQTNIPDFTTLLTINEADITTPQVFQTFSVDLSAYEGSSVYVAFVMTNDDGDAWILDNVDLVELPSCFEPGGFTAGTITSTSFEIDWTDTNSGSPTWEIEWGADGFTQGSGTLVSNIATPTYNFTGLTQDTAYDFYIRTNCGGAEGDSDWVGPIGFTTAYDCSQYGLPYNENWANDNAYFSCYTVDNANADSLSWTFNGVNDFDGDGTDDNIINIFPQAANVAKDDWVFTPAISGIANADYMITVRYNGVDINATANESFELVITDSPSSMATMQTVIGSYSGITQQGVFGDMTGNDFLTQAYTSSETYTPTSSGDFYIGIHANTTAANSDVFLVSSIAVSETLSDNEFERNSFSHYYDENSQTLNLESSDLPLTGLEIFSTLGQSVVSRSLSKKSETINVSDLSPGVYLAKVEIDGNFKTLKFIRK
ncbi:choice-of-anchor J domain-containing protein [Winogradskyella poriferorum]|uniref:choice-of-anchor J domain-containing protein n=1 Tax=Winogradskyella poriferorum TaxID=307627 RepID=UPI003D64CFF3